MTWEQFISLSERDQTKLRQLQARLRATPPMPARKRFSMRLAIESLQSKAEARQG